MKKMNTYTAINKLEVIRCIDSIEFYVSNPIDPNRKPELEVRHFVPNMSSLELQCLANDLNNAIQSIKEAYIKQYIDKIKRHVDDMFEEVNE